MGRRVRNIPSFPSFQLIDMVRLFTRHLRAAFGAFLLVTGFSGLVPDFVAAIGADAVALRPGRERAAHPARATSLAATLPGAAASATTAAAATAAAAALREVSLRLVPTTAAASPGAPTPAKSRSLAWPRGGIARLLVAITIT